VDHRAFRRLPGTVAAEVAVPENPTDPTSDTPGEQFRFAREVFETPVEEEIQESFLAYSLSVITSRAIPDVRDGLKPVQRRILYSLDEQSIRPTGPYKKCARVVGDAMGKYHPHGDSAIYEALVRMAVPFAMRIPLVDGHGNFGSPDDPPAASRYTECRMDHAAVEMVGELREDTVDMRPNYDGTETEPEVMPSRIPNLLVNGTTGIAVGMATNIAPHNLREIAAAAALLLERPDAELDELMALVPGPDFPTGGVIVDGGGIREAYATGRGAFRIRAKAQVGQVTPKRRGITITELPYNVGPERFIAKCKQLINQGGLGGIADIKDLSDRRKGLMIVVECKAAVNPQAVLAELYQKTPLEEGFSINAVALVGGKPETLPLARMLKLYLDHRLEVVRRRTEFRLRRAEERAHIVEGLVKALANIDEVVAIIKKSRDVETAKSRLTKAFELSEIQAGHILEMPLRRLTGLEVTKLKDELRELKATIKDLRDILAKPARRQAIVREELDAAAERFGDERRTMIIGADQAEMPQAALEVPDEPCEVQLSAAGLVARPAKKKGRATKADVLVGKVATTTRSQVRLLTDAGRLLTVDTVEVPESSTKLPGVAAGDLCELDRSERAVAVLGELDEGQTLLLATEMGNVKRLAAKDLTPRSAQIVGLREGDKVVGAVLVGDDEEFVLVTSDAQLLRARAAQVRPQGRSGGGVAGIKLAEGSKVLTVGRAEGSVYTLTDAGGLKHTPVDEYPTKGRATGGVRCMRMRAGETELVAALVGAPDGLGAVTLTSRGAPNKVTVGPSKRDATGEALDDAASLGWV